MSLAVDIACYIGKNVGKIACGAAVAAGAAGVAVVAVKKADDRIILAEKQYAFEHGVRKGVVLGATASQDMYEASLLARVALVYYVARSDGHISSKEQKQIHTIVSEIKNYPRVDADTVKQIDLIAKEKTPGFTSVSKYLDRLNLDSVASMLDNVYSVAEASHGISDDEQIAIESFENYIQSRMAYRRLDTKCSTQKYGITDLESEKKKYYLGLVDESEIKHLTDDYSIRMQVLDHAFSLKTKLNKAEIGLLLVATCLQCLRIYLVNYFTQTEKAGSGNKKEAILHDVQDKILHKFDNGLYEKRRKYYCPLSEIITNRGVPYDTTAFTGNNNGLFKGANHRFATLGHDPIIGLAVGTINIMTNTITGISDSLPLNVPVTYHVAYGPDGKRPEISSNASLLTALQNSIERSKKDLKPLVAAVIKQLIHIATDAYTPAGIQLPGANLVLSKTTVEQLTSFLSAGDVVKIGVSAGIEALINRTIEIIHGCMLMENNSDLGNQLNSVKTTKILLYSNAIATSSSIVQAVITENYKNLDWGGAIVLLSRLFKDVNFIYDVKYEFIRNGLGEC